MFLLQKKISCSSLFIDVFSESTEKRIKTKFHEFFELPYYRKLTLHEINANR